MRSAPSGPRRTASRSSCPPEVVAVDGPTAVARVLVRYLAPKEQEYTDLWLLRFAADGRVEDFEEWAYWPGKPYSAGAGD